ELLATYVGEYEVVTKPKIHKFGCALALKCGEIVRRKVGRCRKDLSGRGRAGQLAINRSRERSCDRDRALRSVLAVMPVDADNGDNHGDPGRDDQGDNNQHKPRADRAWALARSSRGSIHHAASMCGALGQRNPLTTRQIDARLPAFSTKT